MGLLLALLLADPSTMDISLLSKKIALGITLFLIATTYLFKKNSIEVSFHKGLALVILLFIISRGISIFYGRNLSEGLFEFSMNFETFVLLFILLISYQTKEDFLNRFSIPFFIFVLISSSIGWLQVSQIFIEGKILTKDTYYVKSLFSHRNMFAQVLVFSLPFSIHYFSKSLILKVFSVLTFLSSIALILLLFCRSAWLAVAAPSAFLTLFFILKNIHAKKKVIRLGAVLVLLALFVVPFTSLVNKEDVQNQMHTFTNWHYGSAKKRTEIWTGTMNLIGEKTFWGHGLGDWKIEINRYIGSKEVTEDSHTFYQRPHNDFLWIWSESGFLSMLLYLGIFVYAFRKVWHSLKENFSISNPSFIAAFGVISYVLISLLSFPMERVEHQVFLSLFIFLALPEKHFPKTKLKKSLLVFITLMLFAFVSADLNRLNGDKTLKKALSAKDQRDWTELDELIEKARSPFYVLDGTSTPLLWYSGLAKMNDKKFPEALLDFQTAKKENPYHIHVLNSLGSVYFANAQLDSAQANYRELLRINPHFNDAIVNSAIISFNQQNLEESLEALLNIDVEKLNEHQESIIYRMLKVKLNLMAQSEENEDRKSILNRISISQNWTIDVFKKQLLNERSFEEQVHADVEFMMSYDV